MFRHSSILAALGFLASLSTPAAAADISCEDVRLVCSGFEPNWQFELDGGVVVFSDPENPNWETAPLTLPACAVSLSPTDTQVTAGAPLDLDARVVEESCIETSGETAPFSIRIDFNQGAEASPNPVSAEGCCRLPQ